MLPPVFWVKCPSLCLGECPLKKCAKSLRRKTSKSANSVMVSFEVLDQNPIYPFYFSEKQIDLKSVDLKKLKVRDLKKILNDWDEVCDGCLEKADFIKRIEELKPKHIREEL